MRARGPLIVILVVVLLLMSMLAGACGADDAEARAALSAALTEVDAAMAEFMKMDEASTVADVKAAKEQMAPIWAEVVEAARGVQDADAAAAEKVWTDLAAAVDAIPADAAIMDAALAIMGPVQALTMVQNELKALVAPE